MEKLVDRFYRTLYELILKVHMSKSTHLDEYFGLIFKAIKSDKSVPRCIAFVKRLLQMSFLNEANFTAASLLIISETLKARSDLRTTMFSLEHKGNELQMGGVLTNTAGVKLDQAGSDDDEEERFVDVDKFADAKTAQ